MFGMSPRKPKNPPCPNDRSCSECERIAVMQLELTTALIQLTGLIVNSLERLQAATAANTDLVGKAQTLVNTLEASQGDAVPAADVDAQSTIVEANNEVLKGFLPPETPAV